MTALLRLGDPGAERPVLLADDRYFDLTPLTDDIDGAFLVANGIDRAREALAAGALDEVPDAATLRVGAPIGRPAAVLCIGQNYAAHAAESGSAPPKNPMVFLKHPNTVVGPNDPLRRPARATALDWEVELGVVLGRSTYEVAPEDALAAVAGYVVANDVSERTWQRHESGGQFSKGKIGPTFCPVGPWLVPADEVDPTSLRLWSRVNGEPRQDSSSADMVFDVAALIADLSRYTRFEAGDLLLTGTPEGVAMSGRFPYLADGDVIEMGVEGLGEQRTEVVPA